MFFPFYNKLSMAYIPCKQGNTMNSYLQLLLLWVSKLQCFLQNLQQSFFQYGAFFFYRIVVTRNTCYILDVLTLSLDLFLSCRHDGKITQNRIICKESHWEIFYIGMVLTMSACDCLTLVNWYGTIWPTADSTVPQAEILNCVRLKKLSQARLLPLNSCSFDLWQWQTIIWNWKLNKPFCPQLLSSVYFITATEMKLKQNICPFLSSL